MAYSVYWIHWKDNTDPSTQGYVGISKHPETRLQEHIRGSQHKIQKCLRSGGAMSILKSGLTESQAVAEEKRLRPLPNIGLNIAEGGGLPPVRWGHVKSEEETAKRSVASKRNWESNHEKMCAALRNVGEETRRKRSENAKRQHAQGNIGNKGSKHRRIDCPDCGKSVSVACMWRHKCP